MPPPAPGREPLGRCPVSGDRLTELVRFGRTLGLIGAHALVVHGHAVPAVQSSCPAPNADELRASRKHLASARRSGSQ